MDKRISHVINLVSIFCVETKPVTDEYQAFNLVVQRDSKLMLQDSLRMETVSTVTLLFLPIATVAVRLSFSLASAALQNLCRIDN